MFNFLIKNRVMNIPNVFKTTVPNSYMTDLELHSACDSPLQLGVGLVIIIITNQY